MTFKWSRHSLWEGKADFSLKRKFSLSPSDDFSSMHVVFQLPLTWKVLHKKIPCVVVADKEIKYNRGKCEIAVSGWVQVYFYEKKGIVRQSFCIFLPFSVNHFSPLKEIYKKVSGSFLSWCCLLSYMKHKKFHVAMSSSISIKFTWG